jgi:ABC-type lipoprotein export system ATPase subunit
MSSSVLQPKQSRLPTLSITRGEKAFVFGPSGSGKTTLLGLLAGILRADTGSVCVLGQDFTRMSGATRDAFRGAHIGYIFQMFNLRALLGAPEIIMADEPTSALDTDHREQFLALLFESCARTGATLIFVSHDRGFMPLFDRCIALTEMNTIRLVPTL